jgi:hypothetical protein
MLNTIYAEGQEKRHWKKAISISNQEKYNRGEIGEYDEKTLIYDVFLKNDNKTVVVICPPPVNFTPQLQPIYLQIEDKKYKFSQTISDRKMLIFELTLRKALEQNTACTLCIPQGTYQIELDIHKKPLQGLALITLQKNNEIRWVEDWIEFYKTQFGIEHIFIYDNNSDNYEDLCKALDGKATIIPWNFPYGPHYLNDNAFTQIGALNHFTYKYGEACTIFNFDIDELLFCKNDDVKKSILSNYYTQVDSYQGAPLESSTPENYSFKDLLYREKQPRNGMWKYIVKGNIGYLRVHKFKFFYNKFYYFHKFEIIKNGLLGLISKNINKKSPDILPIKQAYFIHYTPITTSWKENTRAGTQHLDEAKFELDILAQQVFTHKAL